MSIDKRVENDNDTVSVMTQTEEINTSEPIVVNPKPIIRKPPKIMVIFLLFHENLTELRTTTSNSTG